jgi:hypothetical protein
MHVSPASASIKVDPGDWIRAPYADCAQCGARDAVGLLMVSKMVALRRCRVCMRDTRQELPVPPSPRVLYLDQWALSSLAKARHPETRERFASEDDRAAGGGSWPRLMARIERLVKANLLVCPRSSIHRAESSLDSRLWDALRRVHVHVSGDARLLDHAEVKRGQLYAGFCAWLDGVEPSFPGREDVLHLRRGWPDLLQVMSSYQPDPNETESLRVGRQSRGERLQRQVETWGSEARTFDERRQEQLAAYGPSFLPVKPLSDLYALTRHAMAERSISVERWDLEVERFLHSESPGRTPFARLACDLLASIGWLAEQSQCPKLDDGMIDDVQAFSAYALTCDAFTVDRRFAHVLRASPMSDRLPRTAIFAGNELDSLESWLIGVEADAPAGHFDLLDDVYGPGWLEPFAGILDPPARRSQSARTAKAAPTEPRRKQRFRVRDAP